MSHNQRGTPQSLRELLYQILTIAGGRDRFQIQGEAIIRDYLSQGFGAFMLKHPEQEPMLRELFDHLTRRGTDET